jgi:hypothetical protein
MNKYQLSILILMCTLFSFACKKNQVCSCTAKATGFEENLIYSFTETNKNAKEVCNSYEKNIISSYNNNGLTGIDVNCDLK